MNEQILIIENQITQYQCIAGRLSGYRTFPDLKDKDDYDRLMERVRIWLNKGYPIALRQEMVGYLKTYIEQRNIRLFIIDYKLSGSSEGFTGIDLALQLNGEGGFKHVPIIFLSRVPENTKELELGRLKDIKYKWVEKGYSGMSLFEESYFARYVLSAIRELLNDKSTSADGKYPEIIDNLLKLPFIRDRHAYLLKKLRKTENLTEEEKKLLDDLSAGEGLTDTEIDSLIQPEE